MSEAPGVLTAAEAAHAKAIEILSMPMRERAADSILEFQTLAQALRAALDFHYGYRDQLPQLVERVNRVFETMSEDESGRWRVKRFEMVEFQKRVAVLADYLRGAE